MLLIYTHIIENFTLIYLPLILFYNNIIEIDHNENELSKTITINSKDERIIKGIIEWIELNDPEAGYLEVGVENPSGKKKGIIIEKLTLENSSKGIWEMHTKLLHRSRMEDLIEKSYDLLIEEGGLDKMLTTSEMSNDVKKLFDDLKGELNIEDDNVEL